MLRPPFSEIYYEDVVDVVRHFNEGIPFNVLEGFVMKRDAYLALGMSARDAYIYSNSRKNNIDTIVSKLALNGVSVRHYPPLEENIDVKLSMLRGVCGTAYGAEKYSIIENAVSYYIDKLKRVPIESRGVSLKLSRLSREVKVDLILLKSILIGIKGFFSLEQLENVLGEEFYSCPILDAELVMEALKLSNINKPRSSKLLKEYEPFLDTKQIEVRGRSVKVYIFDPHCVIRREVAVSLLDDPTKDTT